MKACPSARALSGTRRCLRLRQSECNKYYQKFNQIWVFCLNNLPVMAVPGTVTSPPSPVVLKQIELATGVSSKPSPLNSMTAPPAQLTQRLPSVSRSWKYLMKSILATSSAWQNLVIQLTRQQKQRLGPQLMDQRLTYSQRANRSECQKWRFLFCHVSVYYLIL